MEQTDLALLGCLSEYWSPARFFRHKDAAQIFNRPASLPGVDTLIERLERLIANGFVVAKSGTRGLFIPERSDLREALQSADAPKSLREELFLGLTTLGGKEWQDQENPDWDVFVLCEVLGGKEVRVQAASQDTLKKLLKNVRRGLAGKQIRVMRPWQPLYWKFLPEGFGLSFRAKQVPIALQRAVAEQRRAWLRSLHLLE
jgi:hypothetical protein